MEVRSYKGIGTPTIAGRTISGYAIVFNSQSQIMIDHKESRGFREVIKPQSISEAILMQSDIKMLLEHNRQRLLARSRFGKGTLTHGIDAKGVYYRFTSPNTDDGNTAVELLKRKDLSGSSFSFKVAKDIWTKQGNLWIRTITQIDKLLSFSLTADPEYIETTPEVRSRFEPNTDWKAKLDAMAEKAGIKTETTKQRLERIKKSL